MYNFKNTECQKAFKKLKTNTNMLSTIFYSEDHINVLANRFIKKID